MNTTMAFLHILLICVCWSWGSAQSAACPHGWFVHTNRCYKLFSDQKLFNQYARLACHEHGATLASIGDSDENFFLKMLISNSSTVRQAWVGLVKPDHVCTDNSACLRQGWRWDDGTPYTYQSWYAKSSEPHIEDFCASTSFEGWYGRTCNSEEDYICEKGASVTSTAVPPATKPSESPSPGNNEIDTESKSTTVSDVVNASLPSPNDNLRIIIVAVGSVLGVLFLGIFVLVAIFLSCKWAKGREPKPEGSPAAATPDRGGEIPTTLDDMYLSVNAQPEDNQPPRYESISSDRSTYMSDRSTYRSDRSTYLAPQNQTSDLNEGLKVC